ncbi:MAG TPA: hypothetical protein VJ805_10525 [Nitrospiraceae bacterium]|nr:hypothetical protein [Nitrospiraceae bacterium]
MRSLRLRWFFMLVLLYVPTEGFSLTATEWQGMNPENRKNYVRGVVEGWADIVLKQRELISKHVVPQSFILNNIYDPIVRCVIDKPMRAPGKVMETVEKHVKDNPSHWDRHMPLLIFHALQAACAELK